MNGEQITAFLQEHWNLVTLIIGAVLLIGAIMNWNWLCDPTGKPVSHRYGRGSRAGDILLAGDRADCDQCYVLDVVRRPKR